MGSYIFSLAIYLAAVYFHRITLRPPAPAAKKETTTSEGGKVLKGDSGMMLAARFFNYSYAIPEYLLFACELYGIYAQGVSRAIPPSICPPKSSNLSELYQPNGQLPPFILLACLAAISGGVIRLACYKSLGHMFRWEVSIQDSHKLITSGPYSIVRHPSYSGVLLVVAGQVVRTLAGGTVFQECIVPSVGKWVQLPIWGMAGFRVGVTGWLAWRTQDEDKLLQREFGKQWDAWATKTKYRMIPFVY